MCGAKTAPAAHHQKRGKERSRVPVVSGQRLCAAIIGKGHDDLMGEAAALAEKCHPKIVPERWHLIE